MTDYIKQNFPALLVGVSLVFVLFFGIKVNAPPVNVTVSNPESSLGAINRPSTTITNPFTFQQGVTLSTNANGTSNSLTSSGTTTITASFDGIIANTALTTLSATGTAKSVYTNTFGPMLCQTGSLVVRNNGSFSPSLQFAVGTSTSATGYSTNLLASTTVATSTPGTTFNFTANFLTSSYILGSGESVTVSVSDITNTVASSTHYGNLTVEGRPRCSLIGG